MQDFIYCVAKELLYIFFIIESGITFLFQYFFFYYSTNNDDNSSSARVRNKLHMYMYNKSINICHARNLIRSYSNSSVFFNKALTIFPLKQKFTLKYVKLGVVLRSFVTCTNT